MTGGGVPNKAAPFFAQMGRVAGIAVAAAVAAWSFAHVGTPGGVPVSVSRLGLSAAVAIHIVAIVWAGQRERLMSPALWMALWVAGPFVLIPAAFGYLHGVSDTSLSVVDVVHVGIWNASSAELMVSGFGATLLAVAGLAWPKDTHSLAEDDLLESVMPRFSFFLLLIAVSLVVLRFFVAPSALDVSHTSDVNAFVRHLADGAMPAVSASTTVATYGFIRWGRRYAALLSLNALLGMASIILFITSKIVILVLMSGALLCFVYSQVSVRRVVTAAAIVAAAASVAVIGISNLREHISNMLIEPERLVLWSTQGTGKPYDFHLNLIGPVTQKFWIRQATTGACLQRVIEKRLDMPALEPPWYFMAGAIPQLFWPDKPSLSQGAAHAVLFCGYRKEDINHERPHSASITLLGEPIARAGSSGIVVAIISVALGLGFLSWIAQKQGSASKLFLAALFPWLIDFDQTLSFYFANGLKSALYIATMMAGAYTLASAVKSTSRRR